MHSRTGQICVVSYKLPDEKCQQVVVFLEILFLDLAQGKLLAKFDRPFRITSRVASLSVLPKLNLALSNRKGYPLLFLMISGEHSQALTLVLKKDDLVPAASLTIADTVLSFTLTTEMMGIVNSKGCVKFYE